MPSALPRATRNTHNPPFFYNSFLPPPPPRSEEFKRHKKAGEQFVPTFLREWAHYAATLEAQGGVATGDLGVAMDPAALAALSPQQQDQLSKLQEEARKLA